MTDFRKALGAFATGVTIVTTKDAEGAPIGVTASSFNSVSLDPPLVLWSLAKSSLSRAAFADSGHFAIHVLAESQDNISNRFARSGEAKFAGIEWSNGVLGSPLLDDYAAVFECRTKYQYEGGDHVILVGEVMAYEARDRAPLLFHGGSYAERRTRPPASSEPTVDLETGQFSDDFLFYLISRAYNLTWLPVRRKMAEMELDQQEFSVLANISTQSPATAAAIRDMLRHTGQAPDDAKLEAMVERGLLACRDGVFELENAGRVKLIELLAVSKAFEDDITETFTRGELGEAKRLLRLLIDVASPAA